MASGWIKLHRQIQDCWIWDEDEAFDRRSAWIDLLLLANHDDHKTFIGGELVIVKRGQRLTSIRKLAERWRWGNEKTLKFLRVLESEEMIERSTNAGRTLITIVNYEKFQGADEQDRTQTEREQNSSRTSTEHESSTNKNIKNDKNDKNEKKIYITPLYPPLGDEVGEDETPVQERAVNPQTRRKGFVKPTVDEVATYCESRGNNIDPQEFWDFYESKGWMVGKNPMKDWRASVRTWERSQRTRTNRRGHSSYIDRIDDRINMVDRWVERMEANDDTGVFDTGQGDESGIR